MDIDVKTFEDKAVEELAKAIAEQVIYNKGVYGENYKKIVTLWNQLSDYDQLRAYRRSKYYYAQMNELQNKSAKQSIKSLSIMCIIFIVVACLFCFMVKICEDYVYDLPSQSIMDSYSVYKLPNNIPEYKIEYYNRICITLNKTAAYISDVNHDDLVNCIDYAVTFKKIWDLYYGTKQESNRFGMNNISYTDNNCQIVHNKWDGHFNHLFIRIRYSDKSQWEYIEPQAALNNTGLFYMEDCWSTKEYNPVYNSGDVTDKWLQYIR